MILSVHNLIEQYLSLVQPRGINIVRQVINRFRYGIYISKAFGIKPMRMFSVQKQPIHIHIIYSPKSYYFGL